MPWGDPGEGMRDVSTATKELLTRECTIPVGTYETNNIGGGVLLI